MGGFDESICAKDTTEAGRLFVELLFAILLCTHMEHLEMFLVLFRAMVAVECSKYRQGHSSPVELKPLADSGRI